MLGVNDLITTIVLPGLGILLVVVVLSMFPKSERKSWREWEFGRSCDDADDCGGDGGD